MPQPCLCPEGKFCKFHYSKIYYRLNKETILRTQREVYGYDGVVRKRKPTPKKIFSIKYGEIIINWD
jgi:hypothetical protein